MQEDPELSGVSFIIFDEFHERSLQGDIAFALARDIQQNLREDLTLLLMSATLASETLITALPDAKTLASTGRSFPVSVEYSPFANIRRWREHAASTIKNVLKNHAGSMLVFLPGSGDIRAVASLLSELENEHLMLCPLYGSLSLDEQQKAIKPCRANVRKVVLATNIAETSLTIEGINIVIDSGLENVAIYDESTLTNKLVQRNISKSSAIQRMGRAGRLSEGHCVRLFNEEEFQRRAFHSDLAIHQADILSVVIEAARWQVKTLSAMPFLDLPNEAIERNAWQTLQHIDILNDKRQLTPHGEQVVKLSCHARFGHMIIHAHALEKKHQCDGLAYLACVLTALLEEKDIFSNEQAKANSDVSLRVQAIFANKSAFKHRQIFLQANKLSEKVNVEKTHAVPLEKLGVLLYLAYPERLLKRVDNNNYLASYGKRVSLALDDDLLNESFLVAAVVSQFKLQLQVRLASTIQIAELSAWGILKKTQQSCVNYDEKKERIISVKQVKVGAITLEENHDNSLIDHETIFHLWKTQIEKNGLSFLALNQDDEELLIRWRWLYSTQHQLNFPDVSEQSLISCLSIWLKPFVNGVTTKAQFKKLDVSEMLLTMLDYSQQQQLKMLAPRFYCGPTGRKCAIRYSLEQAPIISLPMQEIYGMKTSPKVGIGQTEVNMTLELLSPAKRPIQVTSDLAGFWQGSYKEVQKDMKSQYPKHYWPDDPANAQPTNKTKRHMKAP